MYSVLLYRSKILHFSSAFIFSRYALFIVFGESISKYFRCLYHLIHHPPFAITYSITLHLTRKFMLPEIQHVDTLKLIAPYTFPDKIPSNKSAVYNSHCSSIIDNKQINYGKPVVNLNSCFDKPKVLNPNITTFIRRLNGIG